MDKISFKNLKTNTSIKGVLIVITIVLLGIFAIIVVNTGKETSDEKIGKSIDEIMNNAGEGLEEFSEEVVDEIDDNTDLR